MNEFKAKVWRGNSAGTGFVKLPQPISLEIANKIRVRVKSELNPVEFFARVVDNKGVKGFYIPRLINSSFCDVPALDLSVEKVNGFYSKVTEDGRIYIPMEVVEENKLRDKDAILITGGEKRRYSRITSRNKAHGGKEYSCTFFLEDKGKTDLLSIRKLSMFKRDNRFYEQIRVKGFDLFSDADNVVVFHGQKQALMAEPSLDPLSLAYYLGAYFADGTRFGNNWGICASTLEQAGYYLESHSRIVLKPQTVLEMSYTSTTGTKHELDLAINKWKDVGALRRIRVIKSTRPSGDDSTKTKYNEYGTLVIKENRKLTQLFYNEMVEFLIREIIEKQNSMLAKTFILGILEGDGNVSAEGHGHLMIATNSRDRLILENVIKITGLEYKVIHTGGHGWSIRLNAISLLFALPEIANRIFKYYPKRRRKFIKRFLALGVCRFLLGEQPKAASWIKKTLRVNHFLDDKWRPTKKGLELVENLMTLRDESRASP